VAQFKIAEEEYPVAPREGASSPVGNARVSLSPAGVSLPLLQDSCHSVWLHRGTAPAERILTMSEADPGSGSSFGFGWSSDGRAVFVFGHHSGFDCRRGAPFQALRIIYTLQDGTAWELPAGRRTRG
jgi:hypothetical protein